jgi:hypothetical protein
MVQTFVPNMASTKKNTWKKKMCNKYYTVDGASSELLISQQPMHKIWIFLSKETILTDDRDSNFHVSPVPIEV